MLLSFSIAGIPRKGVPFVVIGRLSLETGEPLSSDLVVPVPISIDGRRVELTAAGGEFELTMMTDAGQIIIGSASEDFKAFPLEIRPQ